MIIPDPVFIPLFHFRYSSSHHQGGGGVGGEGEKDDTHKIITIKLYIQTHNYRDLSSSKEEKVKE